MKANHKKTTKAAATKAAATRITKAKKAKSAKKAKGPYNTVIPHPLLVPYVLSQFRQTATPRPMFPYIRSLVPNPVPSLVFYHDRTFTEWMSLIRTWRMAPATGGVADALEAAFLASQRQRFLARVYFRKLRMRLAARRCPPGEDLATCSPIPPGSAVTVYDFPHRSRYVFHWQTINKTFLTSLSFSQYGIAQPMTPKNPHTNLMWSLGQRISIVQQITVCAMNRHAFPPVALMWYRSTNYSVHLFLRTHYDSLNVWAALAFFGRRAEDPEVKVIYGEVVDDMYADMAEAEVALQGGIIVRNRVKAFGLPRELQEEWNSLVVSTWIIENHGRAHGGFTSYGQILAAAEALHRRSWAWYTTMDRARNLALQALARSDLRAALPVAVAAVVVGPAAVAAVAVQDARNSVVG